MIVLLMTVKFSRKIYLQIVVAGWSVVMFAVSMLLAHMVGGSGMTFKIHALRLPWFSVVPVSLSILLMTTENIHYTSLRVPLAFVVCAFFSRLGDDLCVVSLANQAQADWVLLLAMFTIIFSCCINVLSPMAFFWSPAVTFGQQLFAVSVSNVRRHWRVLLKGVGWLVLAYFVTNVWVHGRILNLYFIADPGVLVRNALYTTFFLVLLRHFVFIAFAKYVIDVLFPREQTTMWELVVFGFLLAGFQYYLPIGLIVREFLFGLIFGYWYLKTGSLTYGIVVRSLSLIFA